MISDELKNISQRSAAVKYSVVIRVFNDTLQCDRVAGFNPSVAHNLVTKIALEQLPENALTVL